MILTGLKNTNMNTSCYDSEEDKIRFLQFQAKNTAEHIRAIHKKVGI